MTAAAKVLYRSGHCGVDRHIECRGEYAGTSCHCECHILPKPPLTAVDAVSGDTARPGTGSAPSSVAEPGGSTTPAPDLDDVLQALLKAIFDLDQALITFDGNDIEWADLLGRVRQSRQVLADLESLIERDTARAMTGDVLEWPGGLAERRRGKDRKEWDHDAVIRRVREAVVRPLCVDVLTGEVDMTLAALMHGALDAYSETHRHEWRVTKLKGLGVDPDEYCHAVPGRTTVQVTLAGGES